MNIMNFLGMFKAAKRLVSSLVGPDWLIPRLEWNQKLEEMVTCVGFLGL